VPPIPPQCQDLADAVAEVESQAEAVRSGLEGSTGAVAWHNLALLGLMLQQRERLRSELQACIQARTGDLTGELVLIDVAQPGLPPEGEPGGLAPERTPVGRIAYLWDMAGAQPTRAASAVVEGTSFAFAGPLPTELVAITLETLDPPQPGEVDFRSQPFAAPGAGASVRAEVVIGPVVTIASAEVSRWFSALASTQPQHFDVPTVGPLEVRFDAVAASLAPSAIRLTAVGAVTGVGLMDSPLTATADLTIAPATTPGATAPVDLILSNAPSLELTGPAAAIGALLTAVLSTVLGGFVTEQMQDAVARGVAVGAARIFSLVELPPGVTVSARSLTIDSSGIRFQPTLSSLGTRLSTFQIPPGGIIPP
jgi:hypothetical protein